MAPDRAMKGSDSTIRAWRRLAVAGVCASLLVLAACSGGESAETPRTPSPYVAMARGKVDVEGGLIRIVAPRDGRIGAVEAGEGDAVAKDQRLAEIDARAARAALDAAKASLAHAEAEAAVAKAKLPQAKVEAERVGEAASAGAATGQSADRAAASLAVLDAEARAAEAAVAVARSAVAEAELEVDARAIRAPAAGTIVRRQVQVGDFVSATSGNVLFEILPDRPRIVRAEVDESFVDKVKAGMRAEVVRDGDDGRTYAAEVLRVGQVFGPSRLTDDPVERASALDVECVLRLEGSDLRIGQRVLVRFLAGPAPGG